MNATELREAYDAYFRERMKDPAFAQYVHGLGYATSGLHNMLFTFFESGVRAQESR